MTRKLLLFMFCLLLAAVAVHAECTTEYAPVCGQNGISYTNACSATASNVGISCQGTCPCDTSCFTEYSPVCGKNGITYGNSCMANRAKASIAHTGVCNTQVEKKAVTTRYYFSDPYDNPYYTTNRRVAYRYRHHGHDHDARFDFKHSHSRFYRDKYNRLRTHYGDIWYPYREVRTAYRGAASYIN